MLTIPVHQYVPYLPSGVCWSKGQLEKGAGGYLHWQIICCFSRKVRLGAVKEVYGSQAHAELSRSAAADAYVHKEDTAVVGTRFELGDKPFRSNSKVDWDNVKQLARDGALDAIASEQYVRYYTTLKRIAKDCARATYRNGVVVKVFWGLSGSGKSHQAFEEAGEGAYIKSSTTKWWDTYQGQESVIIDEFRGQIAVEHLLKWLDRYPCYVEEKGGQLPLKAVKFWICSNLHPRDWYPNLDQPSLEALLRRMQVTEFAFKYRY